ncbi:MalT transcriptional regulator family protein [Thermus filiformis]|uniref:MalT-like TPR region domain-containing protein n=1 Tax=Thermus filiformis TaxID=276 RepID=A0A0D6XA56_THEFI|nr:hypothetical protein [Thermus filiformis]KIX84547.1 hypothetical protein THFILI_07885 [Thermus filiformis]
MPYRVPKLRLLPPRLPHEVERHRLKRLLEEAWARSPALVLAAGAGYGKTTLLVPYGGVYVALGKEAQDPVVLLWHLVAAYRGRGEGFGELEEVLDRGSWPLALEGLLEALLVLPPHLLVVDEAHLGVGRESLRVFLALLRVPTLRLAFLSRRLEPFEALGRVLTERELAFDPEEAWALAQVLAPELPGYEVERAQSLTRGWPLGLRLMLLAMRKGLRAEEVWREGEPRAALGHLLLASLPEEVQALAARLSVREEVGLEEAHPLLPYAEDLALERLEARLRFHPLVRAALMDRLPEGERRALLNRAAEEALGRGEALRAAQFLLEAGRLGHAADLLLAHGEEFLSQGLTHSVLGLLEALPEEVVQARPGLLLLLAEALRQASRYREAEAAYRAALARGLGRAYLGWARLYLDTVEPAKARPLLEEALRLYPEEARPLLAENLLNEGRVEEAARMGFAGPRLLLRLGRPWEALALLRAEPPASLAERSRPPLHHREGSLLRALLEAVSGSAEEAVRQAERGRWEAQVLESPFGVALAEARRGHALLALGRLEEALQAYRAALALAQGGPPRLQVEALGGLAALLEDWEEPFAQMVRLARASGDAWVEAFMTLTVAMARLRQGQEIGLPHLVGADPFLRALAEAYPFRDRGHDLLLSHPFLAEKTLFALPPERARRLLWEAGRLDVSYHPGVRVEVRAYGGFRVLVGGRPVRFRRRKTELMLALLLEKAWRREELQEALEVSGGEFRVLFSEALGLLEPGRPPRAPSYFLSADPCRLNPVPELYVDLWDPGAPFAPPYLGLDHPFLEEAALARTEAHRKRLLMSPDPQDWLQALLLDPLDEEAYLRLRTTPLAQRAEEVRREALRAL